ncbi:uncharacterized protein RSE6_05442 [Rhynchosporium secalis]|uniref:Uncharacterized protein n=1 Tax=Rhynchosporium secalis TaxID=38038 RepID=A0A1E1M7U6_RHYSE|nr:uncharacterized protein RSE6_05442 [Rhynchosporium secalis]
MSLNRKQEILFGSSDPNQSVLGRIKSVNIDLSLPSTSSLESRHDCREEVRGVLTVEPQPIVSLHSMREMAEAGDAINAVGGLLSVMRL